VNLRDVMLVLEGPDACGKSTLAPLVRRALWHEVHVAERMIASRWVYDRLRRRDESDPSTWLERFRGSGFAFRQVTLTCPHHLVSRRLEARDEPSPSDDEHRCVEELFSTFAATFLRVEEHSFVDASEPIDKCVRMIRDWVLGL
jgi:thymidylate kinase